MQGNIKRLNLDKGYGFITGKDGQEYFFHMSDVKGGGGWENLYRGAPVEFEDEEGEKGMKARDVYPS